MTTSTTLIFVRTTMLAAWMMTACAASAIEIAMRRTASVEADVIRISDIADVQGSDVDSAAAIGEVVVSPAPTRQTVIHVDAIRDRLLSRGLPLSNVAFSGSSQCIVKRSQSRALPSSSLVRLSHATRREVTARLEANVLARLREAFPDGGPFRVSVTANDRTLQLLETMDAPISFYGGTADLSQPQTLLLAGHPDHTFTAHVTTVPLVAVAALPLPRGTIVRTAHVRLEPLAEAEANDPQLLTDLKQLVGQEVVRPISAGRPLRKRDLQKTKLVRGNEIVTVTVAVPGLAVHRLMKAKSDGGLGDTVTCTSLDNRQTIIATVTGPNTAEIPLVSSEVKKASTATAINPVGGTGGTP